MTLSGIGIAACLVAIMMITGIWRPWASPEPSGTTIDAEAALQDSCMIIVADWAQVDASTVTYVGELGNGNPNSGSIDLQGRYPDNVHGPAGEWRCGASRGDSQPFSVIIHPYQYGALDPTYVAQEIYRG